MTTTPLKADKILQGRDIPEIFRLWGQQHRTQGFNPLPILQRLSAIFEEDAEAFAEKSLYPFEKVHQSVDDLLSINIFGMKIMCPEYDYFNRLIENYLNENFFTQQNINKSSLELNISACRLILNVIRLERPKIFDPSSIINDNLTRIYSWAKGGIEPLQSYAPGLLAVAMKDSEIAEEFKELNLRLIPKMLKRIKMLQARYKSRGDIPATSTNNNENEDTLKENHDNLCSAKDSSNIVSDDVTAATNVPADIDGNANISAAPNNVSINTLSNSSNLIENENCRDGTTPKNLIKSIIPIYPATIETSQMFILRYLTEMGEYKEFLELIFKYNVVQLILSYIENVDARNTCLALEALRYLLSLLCHKKFVLEFLTHGGLELLLKIPHPASNAVSVIFYYLAHCEDAMERICSMPKAVISKFVSYGLSLLDSKHYSANCYATMVFGLGFQFKVILGEFDKQDGLRKIYNVISMDHIYSFTQYRKRKEKQQLEHVCFTLKRYMESHLFFKYHQTKLQYSESINNNLTPILKTNKCTLEQIGDQIRYLQKNTPVIMFWEPVDNLLYLGGIKLLLPIVAHTYNSSGSQTLRSVLDVLSVCCVKPEVYKDICDCLNGKLLAGILNPDFYKPDVDIDVQKSALALLIHIVCAPLSRLSSVDYSLVQEKIANRDVEVLGEKIWENVCSNNGIFVLLQLIQSKVPETDADCIRRMACQALAGLARSKRVKQIFSKLPLFANGQLQHLMHEPILQEKRVEHVAFQKYAIKLLIRVCGKTMNQSHSTIVKCPQFDVLVPHKCPDPKPNRVFDSTFDYNLTARLFKSQAGYNTMRLDRHYVHQQFSPIKIIRPKDPSKYQFSCCDFLSSDTIIAGTYSGEAKLYNINNSVEEYTTQCHDDFIRSIKCNHTGNLVLTTTTRMPPFSILWSLDNNNRKLISKLRFNNDLYMEFSNLGQDKILGTNSETARLYDLNTEKKIFTFKPNMCNHYKNNRATFCPTDNLILSDGVLWDVRSGTEIHKFDKLNPTVSGVFHPNNLEIISNTEIWDLRTFHLLQTVSALDQCLIKFSPLNVIYAINELNTNNYVTSFKVLDSYDYASISTIDVKQSINDLNISKSGNYIILCQTPHSFEADEQELPSIKIYG